MRLRQYYVYITSSGANRVLYTGVTSNLKRRVYQHRTAITPGFTQKYKVDRLVYFEVCDTAEQAIQREKQLKNWHREWKLNLILSVNREFRDLYDNL